jgi:hypothetical protein
MHVNFRLLFHTKNSVQFQFKKKELRPILFCCSYLSNIVGYLQTCHNATAENHRIYQRGISKGTLGNEDTLFFYENEKTFGSLTW